MARNRKQENDETHDDPGIAPSGIFAVSWIAPVAWGTLAFASVGFAFLALFGPELFITPSKVILPIAAIEADNEFDEILTGTVQAGSTPRPLEPLQELPPEIGVQEARDRFVAEILDQRLRPVEKLVGEVQKRSINNGLTNNTLEDRIDQLFGSIEALETRIGELESASNRPSLTNRNHVPEKVKSSITNRDRTIVATSDGSLSVNVADRSRGVREIPLPPKTEVITATTSATNAPQQRLPQAPPVDEIDLVELELDEELSSAPKAGSVETTNLGGIKTASLQKNIEIETASTRSPTPQEAASKADLTKAISNTVTFAPKPRPSVKNHSGKYTLAALPARRPGSKERKNDDFSSISSIKLPMLRPRSRLAQVKPVQASEPARVSVEQSPPIITGSTSNPIDATLSQTLFAIDLGTYPNMAALDEGWAKSKKEYAGLLGQLNALANVNDGTNGVELRLVAGPFKNAADAASYCARLVAQGQRCQPSIYLGQPR